MACTAIQGAPVITAGRVEERSLRDRLGEATCKWMRAIADNYVDSSRIGSNPELIKKGVWYATEHYKALEALGERAQKINRFFDANDAHIVGYIAYKKFDMIEEASYPVFNGKRPMHFVVKTNVLPSEALRVSVAGLSIIDCGVACQIARYGALLDILGERKFNILFGSSSKGQRMNIGYSVDDERQPMKHFVDFILVSKQAGVVAHFKKVVPLEIIGTCNARVIKVGQLAQIKGVTSYPCKHPWDINQSHNLICCSDEPGEQLYLGLGKQKEGESEQAICQSLVDAYNQPTDWSNKSPKVKIPVSVKLSAQFARHQVESLDSERGEGFDVGSIQDFRVDLIQDLIDLPEKEVSMDFVRNHESQKQMSLEEIIATLPNQLATSINLGT